MDVDKIIETLLSVRGNKPGKQVDLKDEEIRFLIDKSQAIIREQKMLVELEAPLHVCGDIHGQYYDLLRIFEHCGYPGEYNYLFLGDYVDRGKQSLETICLLLCYKIKYPDKVTLLRGNHESSVTNRIYGFYDECKRRYNVKLWKSFTELFNFLPVAALIDDKILCMHGGLSPDLKSINNITEIQRPTDIPDTGLLCDLLWSDPDKEATEYDENDRGVSVIFGEKVVTDFNKKNDLDLIIRAHQVVDDGYEFFANRQLITIFSAKNYCGENNLNKIKNNPNARIIQRFIKVKLRKYFDKRKWILKGTDELNAYIKKQCIFNIKQKAKENIINKVLKTSINNQEKINKETILNTLKKWQSIISEIKQNEAAMKLIFIKNMK